MTDLATLFADLSGVSEAKDFPQSQEEQETLLDQPEVFQEYDDVEREITLEMHMVTELYKQHDMLQFKKAVNKYDRLSLESICAQLANDLPSPLTYTEESSIVNYKVTQESVFTAIGNGVKAIIKKIIDTIKSITDWVYNLFAKLFGKEKTKEVEQAVKETKKIEEKATTSKEKVEANQKSIIPSPLNVEDPKLKGIVITVRDRLAHDLKPRYGELPCLDPNKDVHIDVIHKEAFDIRMLKFTKKLHLEMINNASPYVDVFNEAVKLVDDNKERLRSRTNYLLKDADITQVPEHEDFILFESPSPALAKMVTTNTLGDFEIVIDEIRAMISAKKKAISESEIPTKADFVNRQELANAFKIATPELLTYLKEMKDEYKSLRGEKDKSVASNEWIKASKNLVKDWIIWNKLYLLILDIKKFHDDWVSEAVKIMEDELRITDSFLALKD